MTEARNDAYSTAFIRYDCNCSTWSEYKYNIVRHLKSCCEIFKKRKGHIYNKVCEVCKITCAKKSNRDRHIRKFYANFKLVI